MGFVSKSNGLSARRMAIDKIRKFLKHINHVMKRSTILGMIGISVAAIILIFPIENTTHAERATTYKKDSFAIIPDSLIKPDVRIKVNKHYDDSGNLIGYDSIYSSHYYSVVGDTTKRKSWNLNSDHFSFFNNDLNKWLYPDSLFYYPNLVQRDFFLKRYGLNDPHFRNMMHWLDSIKSNFYREQVNKRKDLKQL